MPHTSRGMPKNGLDVADSVNAVVGAASGAMHSSNVENIATKLSAADVDPSKHAQIVANAAHMLSTGSLSILTLVEALGPALTDPEVFVRARGTGALAAVVEAVLRPTTSSAAHKRLTHQEATVLVAFFVARLDDQPSVGEAVRGLLALVASDGDPTNSSNLQSNGDPHAYPHTITAARQSATGGRGTLLHDSDLEAVVRGIFSSVVLQTFQQLVRHNVYRILLLLLERHIDVVRSRLMGQNEYFVARFVSCFEGEKDPRNLMISFRIVKLITQRLKFTKTVEDLFAVVFCYFPIMFRPPPDDVFGITAEHLKAALAECISATPLFAKHALPLLVEKLSSSAAQAKKDSLVVLEQCALVYDYDDWRPYLVKLWPLLYREATAGIDNESERLAARVVQALVKALSLEPVAVNVKTSSFSLFLGPACDSISNYVADAEFRNASSVAHLLYTIASATDPANTFVATRLLPTFLEKVRIPTNLPTQRKILLDMLAVLLTTTFSLRTKLAHTSSHSMDTDLNRPLEEYHEEIVKIFKDAAENASFPPFRCSGLKGLASAIICGIVAKPVVKEILQTINTSCFPIDEEKRTIESDSSLEVIRRGSTDALVLVASYMPNVVIDESLELIKSVISFDTVFGPLYMINSLETTSKEILTVLQDPRTIELKFAILSSRLNVALKVFSREKVILNGLEMLATHLIMVMDHLDSCVKSFAKLYKGGEQVAIEHSRVPNILMRYLTLITDFMHQIMLARSKVIPITTGTTPHSVDQRKQRFIEHRTIADTVVMPLVKSILKFGSHPAIPRLRTKTCGVQRGRWDGIDVALGTLGNRRLAGDFIFSIGKFCSSLFRSLKMEDSRELVVEMFEAFGLVHPIAIHGHRPEKGIDTSMDSPMGRPVCGSLEQIILNMVICSLHEDVVMLFFGQQEDNPDVDEYAATQMMSKAYFYYLMSESNVENCVSLQEPHPIDKALYIGETEPIFADSYSNLMVATSISITISSIINKLEPQFSDEFVKRNFKPITNNGFDMMDGSLTSLELIDALLIEDSSEFKRRPSSANIARGNTNTMDVVTQEGDDNVHPSHGEPITLSFQQFHKVLTNSMISYAMFACGLLLRGTPMGMNMCSRMMKSLKRVSSSQMDLLLKKVMLWQGKKLIVVNNKGEEVAMKVILELIHQTVIAGLRIIFLDVVGSGNSFARKSIRADGTTPLVPRTNSNTTRSSKAPVIFNPAILLSAEYGGHSDESPSIKIGSADETAEYIQRLVVLNEHALSMAHSSDVVKHVESTTGLRVAHTIEDVMEETTVFSMEIVECSKMFYNADILSGATHAQANLDFKRRLFDTCIPLILAGCGGGGKTRNTMDDVVAGDVGTVRNRYLQVLCVLLGSVPVDLIVSGDTIAAVFPLVTESLERIDDWRVRVISLQTMETMIRLVGEQRRSTPHALGKRHASSESSLTDVAGGKGTSSSSSTSSNVQQGTSQWTVLVSHMGTLIRALSGCTRVDKTNGPNVVLVRVLAVRCLLRVLETMPFSAVFPYSKEVSAALERAASDRKWLVRRVGSEARARWAALRRV